MTDDIKQQLSALIDGELDPAAGRFLLRRLQREPELSAQWERWHLARDCLQRQRVTPLREDFAARIAAALADEARPASRGATSGVLRWAGGFAVAASVAIAALLAVPSPSLAPAGAPASSAQAQVVPSGLSERDLRPNLGPVAHSVAHERDRPAGVRVDPWVEAYLMRHNAALMQSGEQGFAPFVPALSPARQWSMLPPAEPERQR